MVDRTAFKGWKSLFHIDALRAFDPDLTLTHTHPLAKLLGAVLVVAILYSLQISRSNRYPPPCGVCPH
jgi:hypothetical protein